MNSTADCMHINLNSFKLQVSDMLYEAVVIECRKTRKKSGAQTQLERGANMWTATHTDSGLRARGYVS